MSEVAVTELSVELGGKLLVDKVSITLKAGECLALVGRNGAGKTTLLRAMLGLLPFTGEVSVDGNSMRQLKAKSRAEAFAYLPQHDRVSEALTAQEVVEAARLRFDETRAASREAALAALAAFDASSFASQMWPKLSGGERQRVALAAMFAQQARFAFLDEPANHLDPARRLEVLQHVRRLSSEHGTGVIVVTHDLGLLHALGEPAEVRIVGMRDGKLRCDSTLADSNVISKLSAVFDCAIRRVEVDGRELFIPWPEDAA